MGQVKGQVKGRDSAAAVPRAVLDTNVVLSALVFGGGVPGALRRAWQSGDFLPLVSRVTAAELVRVLTYPKFKLGAAEQEELLADYLPFCETVTIPDPPPRTPACRDAHDLPFLELAIAGDAAWLVTGDADLHAVAAGFICPIVNAASFLEHLRRPDA
ncbi:putative toxin-antitoxin system toxin component, PIN family [Aromatoleum bremense]|nr:putative toxin-antitoxin system toxin component, PIN family [Aromatoleum bremense]QTQ33834.1 Putative toxin-antitoxin system toxin, PIN family [Aromatoleum bremense]